MGHLLAPLNRRNLVQRRNVGREAAVNTQDTAVNDLAGAGPPPLCAPRPIGER